MKVYQSSVLRPYGSLVRGSLVTSLAVGTVWAYSALQIYGLRGKWRPEFIPQALESPLFLALAGIVLLIAVPLVLTSFGQSRGTYRVGPTDLEIRSGWLHQTTRWIKLSTITQIELSQGPLMQLLATTDLKIRSAEAGEVILYGIRDARDLRFHLLDRRDSLTAVET
jgi:membrane protein YdbS with pleckstrin-like domain